ncbi:6508_t:CDS:2, partial [Gigaspora rosea]
MARFYRRRKRLDQKSKKNYNNNDLLSEEPQWIDIRNNKTSWDKVIECGWSCVYNSQTSNINYHLESVYKKYEEKSKQIKIDDQLKKVIPHKELKQNELQHAVTDWIINDSQPFGAAN